VANVEKSVSDREKENLIILLYSSLVETEQQQKKTAATTKPSRGMRCSAAATIQQK
jgi:hypothetical protein